MYFGNKGDYLPNNFKKVFVGKRLMIAVLYKSLKVLGWVGGWVTCVGLAA